jgi:crossover junction endodeoxyribonuclease RuvC
MSQTFIGIDPGLDGAIATIGPLAVRTQKTPIFSGERRQMNLPECGRILSDLTEQGPVFAVIEKVGAMPKQGVSSTFSFGKGYGQWLGMLAAYRIAYQEVTPQAWKKALLEGTDKSKTASINRAASLFPGISFIPEGCRTPHDGMAEALLIAEYGRRMYLR